MRNYIVLEPKDIPAQLHLGLLYVQKADAAEKAGDGPTWKGSAVAAFNTLEEALRNAGDSVSPEELRKARLSDVKMALIMVRFVDSRALDAAESYLTVLLKETPDDPELLDLNGMLLSYKIKPEEACEQFRKAVKIDPRHMTATWLWRAFFAGGCITTWMPTK